MCLVSIAWAGALAGGAYAQDQDACVYADQNYSHGAIFAGTRCNNGAWMNLSAAEFRRLYPNGLGGTGVAPASDGAGGPTENPAPPNPPEANGGQN